MKIINVMVRDKIASAVGDIVYICGNSDYIIRFDFDAEWDAYGVKTARFVHNGTYTDVVFTGEQCAMPVIHKAYGIFVGVYAGDLRTTTPAHIPSAASILSTDGTPEAPPDDVYAQITALCNEAVSEAKSVRKDADAGKFDGAPGKTPVPGVDYFTPEDKQAIAAEAAQEVGFPQPTSADNGKYLGCENGAAKWKPVEASGGGDISLGLTSASVGQTIKVKAVDDNGKPTEWEAVDMLSGGGHWETVLDTIWEQDVINPTAFDSETGIFTCASGELDNLALDTEYVFFQQCVVEKVAYNTILGNEVLKVTKLSETTFSIDATPPTTFVPTNVKFSRGACLVITDIDAKKIRLTLDGQFNPTATAYSRPFLGMNVPYFGANTGYAQIRNAYHAYQQVTAEVESPYRIVGEILCGFNAPSKMGSFHFKNNSFCCPLVPTEFSEGNSNFSSDGTKIAKLYSTSIPWHLGGSSENTAIASDYLKIISGTKVKLERWVE